MNTDQYALDTARAKTPAERLRIVADLCDAHASGQELFRVWEDGEVGRVALSDVMHAAGLSVVRLVTKRRHVFVIPALELFEFPLSDEPAMGDVYFMPYPMQEDGADSQKWMGLDCEKEWLAAGICFATKESAAAIGLHIRNELAKAARS